MTSFCHQLKLLLWKNYILRKRHKVRMVLELVWPLILFLILMWVRTRGLRLPQPACHLIEKSLPSVGGFQFLQNYICSLNNTCYDNQGLTSDAIGNPVYVEDKDGHKWDDASLPKFVRMAAPSLQTIVGTPEGTKAFQEIINDLKEYTTFIRNTQIREEFRKSAPIKLGSLLRQNDAENLFLQDGGDYLFNLDRSERQELLETYIHLKEWSKVSYDKIEQEIIRGTLGSCQKQEIYKLISVNDTLFAKICNLRNSARMSLRRQFETVLDTESATYQKMRMIYNESGSASERVLLQKLVTTHYNKDTLDALRNLLSTMQKFREELAGIFSPETEIQKGLGVVVGTRIVYKSFCGIELAQNESILGISDDSTNSFDTLRDRLRDLRSKRTYKIDKDVGPLCNTIFEQLESRPVTNVLWRQMKPFIRGKLLYYPRTNFTDAIMKRVDEKFSELEELEQTFNAALSILHRIRAWLKDHRQDFKILQDAFADGNSSQIQSFMRLLSSLQPERASEIRRFINEFKTINLNQTEEFLERIDIGSEVESEVMNCIRYNKSTPYRTGDNNTEENTEFTSEDDAVEDGMKLMMDNNLWAVIVFLDLPKDGSSPRHLQYKIRMDSDKVDGTRNIRDRLTRRHPRRRPSLDIKYITSGFIYIQEMIEQAFVESATGQDLSGLSFVIQQFPFPCYIFDQFIRAISSTFPLFMVLSWVYASAMLIKSIVLEKELRLKEVMKVMGCGNSVIWTAWFIDSFVVMAFSCLILTFMLKYGKIIEHSDITVILVFLIVFSIVTICFSFFVSTFFTKANSAAAAGGILFFVSYLPYYFMLIWEDRLTWYHTLCSCLLSNVAFGFGCTYIARLEEDGIGAQWNRISIKTLPGDDFNFSYCVIMLIFDSLLYLGLAFYIEAVFPGDNGMPRKWYFLFQKSFWSRESIVKSDIGEGYKEYSDSSNKPIVEADPEGLRCGVSVRHLCKKYGNGRVALSDLNMSFYENQITSFLGHNGAGKTTTISILTGLFPPSEGTALIYGKDIRTDIGIIRRDLGICPQHNVLFDRLTVAEHMIFYADLKGKYNVVKKEMNQMLFDLGIPHKKTEFPKNLSGGMKRKLSVACAFVGGSRTVFLDEPTSGVDPYSRRSIWELLLKYKYGRTIILTTHFMDEADLLGDRIAIISQGQLKAFGTSLFLKSEFGQGYFIRLVREIEDTPAEEVMLNNILPGAADTKSRKTKKSDVTSIVTKSTRHTALFSGFIKHRIPEARLVSDIGSDVVFLLPTNRVNDYEILFKDLDENMGNLKMLSYGISDTTLEDVFLQITVEDLDNLAKGGDHPMRACCCYTKRLRCAVWKMRNSLKRKKRKKSYQSIDLTVEPPARKSKTGNKHRISPELSGSVALSKDASISTGDRETTEITPVERIESKETSPMLNPVHNSLVANEKGVNDPIEKHSMAVEVQNDSSETETESEDTLLPPPRNQASLFGIKRGNVTPVFWVQIWVIILKRFRNSNRNKKAIFFEVIVPALFIALTLATTLIVPPPANEANRQITFTAYDSPNNIFFSTPDNASDQFRQTVRELLGPIGPGTPCLADNIKEGKCDGTWDFQSVNNFRKSALELKNASLGSCSCSTGAQVCHSDIEIPPPPKLKSRAQDFILDVSKYHVPDWITKTYFQYDVRRYGGYEMFMREPEEVTISEFISLLDSFTVVQEANLIEKHPDKEFYKIWFENRGWLSSVSYLNALHNLILRQNINSPTISNSTMIGKDMFGITLYTHPMNLTAEQQKKESIKTAALGVVHAICIIFAMSFVPASFTVYLIEERRSGAKHLHLVSGVKPFTYWISNFIFDMTKYLFTAMLCVLLFVAFDATAYISKDSAGAFILLLILYGWAAIPLMYPASYVFSIPSTAFVVLACSNLFIGIVTTVSTFVLDQLGDKELKDISLVLQDVFLVFPHYCLGRGLIELVKLHVEATAFGKLYLDDFTLNRFQWNILGKILSCLFIHGIVFFACSILLEYKQWVYLLFCKKKLAKKRKRVHDALLDEEEDEDVKKEVYRILNNPPTNASLLAENLAKIYSGKKRPAVNNLCFAVQPGECFGLLGVNGAGKSTTFKMLTGDSRITSGKAYIMGFDVEKSLDSARKHYGYCPQEDGIDPLLNSFEQLELYGRLRGLTSSEVTRTAFQLVASLGLTRYANRQCGTYSGGNKRKVSTAIALIGNPDVVFLDEPTSGMDPGARRQLWKLIIAVTRMGKSVVLTSHSMEECEALCSRLAIMVNGKFTCLGSLQHLKNRFGKGYRLNVRCPVPKQQEFIRSMESSLRFAKLEDTHCTQLKFNIPQEEVRLGDIFSVMCTARNDGIIEDFSVSQTTLDDIFIKFASDQRDELDRKLVAVIPVPLATET